MGTDVILCIILVGFICIFGGFGSYGCYRCCTDKVESRIHSEDSLKNQELYKRHKKSSLFECFRNRDKYSRNCSSSNSTSSFTGTIYTVNSEFGRESDGKVPFDLLWEHNNCNSINKLPRVLGWTLQNELEGKKKLKPGDRAMTAPA